MELTTALPSSALRRCAPQLGLILLLIAELLFLTITFDTQSLEKAPSIWTQLIGWSPQYLRLATTVALVTLLLSGRRLLLGIGPLHSRAARWSPLPYLAVHGCALLLFIGVTAIILSGEFSSWTHPVAWTLAWFLTGAGTLIAWSLALYPWQTWLTATRKGRNRIYLGLALGTTVWAGGFLSEEFWTPQARYTFNVVQWILSVVYPVTIGDASRLVVGTPTFNVAITPQCSGYEGVGLILAFLTVYLWMFRKDLRFPSALALLPMGAVAIWTVNVLRIVALIIIGTSGWPAIALGGFHSQAGWLAFNAVGLGFVALTNRGRYFMTAADPPEAVDNKRDPTTAYLAPLLAIIATAMLTGALSAGFDWLYPLRVLAAAAVLWTFRKSYADLKWTVSWWAISIGAVTFVIWLTLIPGALDAKDGWPAAMGSVPWHWAGAWLLIRVVGYVVTVPLAEELAFRGFLTRRIIRADFQNLPVGIFTWSSFLISSALFGAFHGGLWLAGTIAGMTFALALYHRRVLGDAVQAHATTNVLIVLYVFVTGRWSVWS